jgi:hypothetical protein
MRYTTYESARAFLDAIAAIPGECEEANSLMLGICWRLTNAPGAYGDAPPLFASVRIDGRMELLAVRTPPHKAVLHGSEGAATGAAGVLAARLRIEHGTLPGIIGPPRIAHRFAESWAHLTGAVPLPAMRQRVLIVRTLIPAPRRPGALRPANGADLRTLERWAGGFHREVFDNGDTARARRIALELSAEGRLYVWDDAGPVSMAARTRPTPTGESISFVYTPPEHRRKGYATACVGSLCREIVRPGKRFCTLVTDRAAPAANALYRKLGFHPVAELVEYRFG